MSLWIIWLIAAGCLLLVEVLTQMIWTACLAIGCLLAMILGFFDADLAFQILAVAFGTLLAFIVLGPKMRRWIHGTAEPHKSRTGMDALIGRTATVTHEIQPDKLGRVKIDGDSWQARNTLQSETLPQGTKVIVSGFDSIILNVTPS